MTNVHGDAASPFAATVLQNRFNLVAWLAMLCEHPHVWQALGGNQQTVFNDRLLCIAKDALTIAGEPEEETVRRTVQRVLGRNLRQRGVAKVYVLWALVEMVINSYRCPADKEDPLIPQTQLIFVTEDQEAAWARAADAYVTSRLNLKPGLADSLRKSAQGVDMALGTLGNLMYGEMSRRRARSFWSAMLRPEMVALMQGDAPDDVALWTQTIITQFGAEAGKIASTRPSLTDMEQMSVYIMKVLQRISASPRRAILQLFGSHGADLLQMASGYQE